MGKYFLVLVLVGPLIWGIIALIKASSIVEQYDKQAKIFVLGGLGVYLPTKLIERNQKYREKYEKQMGIVYKCFLAEIIIAMAFDRYIHFFGH
ncbi:hypothetical protein [Pleomorphomonas sp. NRK KF1]|uniref:hypothetical protein n=1 Tax=Pleomorphomonas sp. NRK KF1 TaxID=2943000 RepID=UPI002043E827|nr:hypothetical protein [Pleomorphomonas sp. NRK KF1]MCM5555247.1 hypothetical protein [Pleomorphomonas sp. NRK KF1]